MARRAKRDPVAELLAQIGVLGVLFDVMSVKLHTLSAARSARRLIATNDALGPGVVPLGSSALAALPSWVPLA